MKKPLLFQQTLLVCSLLVEKSLHFEAIFFDAIRVLVFRLMNTGEGTKSLYSK